MCLSSLLYIVSVGKWDFRLLKLSLCNEAELLILLRIASSPLRKTSKENESSNLYFTAYRRKTHLLSLIIYMHLSVPLGTRWVPCSFQKTPDKHGGDMVAYQNLFRDIVCRLSYCVSFPRVSSRRTASESQKTFPCMPFAYMAEVCKNTSVPPAFQP